MDASITTKPQNSTMTIMIELILVQKKFIEKLNL
jgi:hypothetical protein